MKNILKNKTNFIFISPHLDDAIFSAGGLINRLYKSRKKITIINVFTNPSRPPYTISAKKYLDTCGYKNADDFFSDRISEDLKVAKKLKARVINLGFIDALWRRKRAKGLIFRLSKLIPELNYVYPIFRISIAKGFISKHDAEVIRRIEISLKKYIKTNSKTIIFCPLGIGKHTDHLIVREVVAKNYSNVIFWEDYPYSETNSADDKFINLIQLKPVIFKFDEKVKNSLVNGYESQMQAIFGSKRASVKPSETYYHK